MGPFSRAYWAQSLPWVDIGVLRDGEAPARSVVEGFVTAWDDLDWHGPETSRRSVLQPNTIIGFDVWIWDRDDYSGAQGVYLLGASPRTFPGQWADDFADGQLIPCEVGDCSGASTAVRADSWGRIKASLRR